MTTSNIDLSPSASTVSSTAPVEKETHDGGPDSAAVLRTAFDEIQAELEAVDPSTYAPINIDIPAALITVRGHLSRIRAYRDAASRLPDFDMSCFDKLEVTTLAVGHAYTHFQAASGPAEPVAPLVEELTKARELLTSDATTLSKHAIIDGERMKQLQGTNGFKNLAFDVLLLCALLREKWSAIGGRTVLQLSDLDRAEKTASRLTAALGDREAGGGEAPAAATLRQAAFTLFTNRYDQVRRAISYLRWSPDDVEEIAPSLYAGRGGRGKPAEAPTPDVPAAPPAAPSPPIAGSPTVPAVPPVPSPVLPSANGASNGTSIPAAASLIGLPGGPPFTR